MINRKRIMNHEPNGIDVQIGVWQRSAWGSAVHVRLATAKTWRRYESDVVALKAIRGAGGWPGAYFEV